MHRKIRFKNGERVNAISLSGKKVLGEYRGIRGSFGALIFGIEVGSFAPASLHVCTTLSMERAPVDKPKSTKPARLKAGDTCSGLTKDGEKIIGSYMNADGKHAWIRGYKAAIDNISDLRTAYKVLTSTLKKV